jgi:hypothetical protein
MEFFATITMLFLEMPSLSRGQGRKGPTDQQKPQSNQRNSSKPE